MSDPVCTVDLAGFCERHDTVHVGATLDLSQDQGDRGAYYRLQWDHYKALRGAPMRERLQVHTAPKAKIPHRPMRVHGPARPQPIVTGSRIELGLLPAMSLAPPCVWFGAPVVDATGKQRKRKCVICPGNVSANIWVCDHPAHETTTIKECQACADRSQPRPPSPELTRNLIYHLMPVANTGVWQWNVEQLRQRWPLFNGRRIIAVVAPGESDPYALDSIEAVKSEFDGMDAEFIEVPNVVGLREVASWGQLFERVASNDPTHLTFYAHAKGVTAQVNTGVTVHPWTEILYHTCLDYPSLVEGVLGEHPVAGSFLKVGHGFAGSRSDWHYSGSFYWIRSAEVGDAWRKIERKWWGVESWPSLAFGRKKAGLLFHQDSQRSLDLYRAEYMERTVLPALKEWRNENRSGLWVYQ